MKKISVVLPCYNEEENVRPIYEAVREVLVTQCPAYDYEILFIDNKSKDKTRQILTQMCAEDKHVKAIFNMKNFGQNNSPYYGVLNSTGDCTILMASDFQDPVEVIPKFVEKWEEGYKIVIAQKVSSQENKIMYFLRGCYYKAIRLLSSVEMIEHFTGFGLYDKSFVDVLRGLKEPTPLMRGLVAELGPEYATVDFVQPQRRAGRTSNNFFSLFDVAMLSFTSYTKMGLRIATFTGFGIAILSFLFGLFYLVAKLVAWDSFSAGYAPTMIAVFFMGGVQLAFLGFLGEYIMAMNARIMDRPLVVEETRLNFEESSD